MSAVACPCCDVDAMGATPVMALALGVSIGAAFGDTHLVTERVCERHRGLWLVAMMRASVFLNTTENTK